LEQIPKGAEGEIQLTDAIARLLDEQQVLAYRFQGKRFDCDYKLGYLKATIEFAVQHRDVGHGFADYLHDLCASGRFANPLESVEQEEELVED
ncbi:MAG: UTP--glucose-1-phosphate uridylyltransferase, partial [Pseudomonadota bacterium]